MFFTILDVDKREFIKVIGVEKCLKIEKSKFALSTLYDPDNFSVCFVNKKDRRHLCRYNSILKNLAYNKLLKIKAMQDNCQTEFRLNIKGKNYLFWRKSFLFQSDDIGIKPFTQFDVWEKVREISDDDFIVKIKLSLCDTSNLRYILSNFYFRNLEELGLKFNSYELSIIQKLCDSRKTKGEIALLLGRTEKAIENKICVIKEKFDEAKENDKKGYFEDFSDFYSIDDLQRAAKFLGVFPIPSIVFK